MKKWVKYIPIYLGVIGFFLGMQKELSEGFAYWIGAGIGLFVISSVPALVIGSLHYIPVRHKTVGNNDRSDEFLDTEAMQDPPKKKYTWYYLYCCYLGGFGLFFTIILLIQISRGEY